MKKFLPFLLGIIVICIISSAGCLQGALNEQCIAANKMIDELGTLPRGDQAMVTEEFTVGGTQLAIKYPQKIYPYRDRCILQWTIKYTVQHISGPEVFLYHSYSTVYNSTGNIHKSKGYLSKKIQKGDEFHFESGVGSIPPDYKFAGANIKVEIEVQDSTGKSFWIDPKAPSVFIDPRT